VRKRFVFVVAIGLAVVGFVSADDNVREVQQKLRDGGFYTGEIDGAYSQQLSVALTRYQIRNGLPITGQLDAESSKALGAKPAVATMADDHAKSSETWRTLRMGGQHTAGTPGSDTKIPPRSAPAATTPLSSESTQAASAPPATVSDTSSSGGGISTERLRDYVGAFVLAGLDPQVGSETDFFTDRVQYYDEGMKDREKIRKDLQGYAARWPERQFWLDGDITVEPQNGNRVLVTFPLRYDLRNGAKHSSGKVNKTLVLEPAGDDLQIVAVNERKAD
jgi:peptidoglycan hydrolase-like protein with peptidoglycan-binding domain